LVPLDEEEEEDKGNGDNDGTIGLMDPSEVEETTAEAAIAGLDAATNDMLSPVQQQRSPSFMSHHSSGGTNNHSTSQRLPGAGRDEIASQVAEGTLRALRDLALEEALELNTALRFWSDRWERPLLSWLEAGPVGTYTYNKSSGNDCVRDDVVARKDVDCSQICSCSPMHVHYCTL
jgi:hypothetical protein